MTKTTSAEELLKFIQISGDAKITVVDDKGETKIITKDGVKDEIQSNSDCKHKST